MAGVSKACFSARLAASAGSSKLRTTRISQQQRRRTFRPQIVAQQDRFDEGSAEVKRLVQRDLKDSNQDEVDALSTSVGPKSLDELEKIFETGSMDSIGVSQTESNPATKKGPSGSTASPFGGRSARASPAPFGTAVANTSSSPFKSTPSQSKSSTPPFGSSTDVAGNSVSPFGQSSGIREPKGLSPQMSPDQMEVEPWWAFVKELKTAQIITVISFTLIILLMIFTFKIVLDSGAIHFNE